MIREGARLRNVPRVRNPPDEIANLLTGRGLLVVQRRPEREDFG